MEAFPETIDLDNLIDEVSATAHPLMEKNKKYAGPSNAAKQLGMPTRT